LMLEIAIKAAKLAAEGMATQHVSSRQRAEPELASAFDIVPAGWETNQHVQAIRGKQLRQFEWELHKAKSLVAQKLS